MNKQKSIYICIVLSPLPFCDILVSIVSGVSTKEFNSILQLKYILTLTTSYKSCRFLYIMCVVCFYLSVLHTHTHIFRFFCFSFCLHQDIVYYNVRVISQ